MTWIYKNFNCKKGNVILNVCISYFLFPPKIQRKATLNILKKDYMYLEKEDISVHSIIDTFTFLHPSKVQEQEWEIFIFHEISWSTKKSIAGDFNGRWRHYQCQDFFTCINLFELSESLSDEQFGYGIIMQQIYFTHEKSEWKRTYPDTPGGKSQGDVWQSLWEIVLSVFSNHIMFRD